MTSISALAAQSIPEARNTGAPNPGAKHMGSAESGTPSGRVSPFSALVDELSGTAPSGGTASGVATSGPDEPTVVAAPANGQTPAPAPDHQKTFIAARVLPADPALSAMMGDLAGSPAKAASRAGKQPAPASPDQGKPQATSPELPARGRTGSSRGDIEKDASEPSRDRPLPQPATLVEVPRLPPLHLIASAPAAHGSDKQRGPADLVIVAPCTADCLAR
ncbi:MAG: hypothetical protein ABJC09_11460, partial [Terriglobia bacterium]